MSGKLIQLLDRPIAYQPAFADLRVGRVRSGTVAAVLLSQFVYWHNRMDSEWLYKTQVDITKETKLTRDEQETARKRLVALGVIDEQRRGVPGKMHFRINVERLEALLLGEIFEETKKEDPWQSEEAEAHNVETPQSTMGDSHNVETPHCGDAPNNNVETPQSTMVESPKQECGNPALFLTEITSESTSKNKTPLTPQAVDNSVAGQSQTAGEIFDYLNLLTGAKTRPDLQAIKPILERLTDGYTADEIKLVIEYRIIQLRGKPDLGHMLSPNFLFSARDFGAYFSAATDWQKKREHQAARANAVEQQRIAPPPAGDVPEIDFDEVFDRLFVDGGAPENQAEKIAMAEAVKNGFGNGSQDQARKKWRVILSRACAKTAGDK